jgi:phosphomannomutase
MQSHFLEQAKLWAAQDPDPKTKAELLALIEANDQSALHARMGSRLEFGTAGLRGELGAGPNRMNRVLVTQTAAGLAEYVLENFPTDPMVVIGFDGRTKSDIFARDSAEVFAAAGIRTLLFDAVVPTPVLAFTGHYLKASASVMVTASHNPPRDNGYKVYLGGKNGGSQIVSPTDGKIAEKIHIAAETKTFDQIAKSVDYEIIGDEMREKYVRATAGITGKVANGNSLKIVYTAMHGVGWSTLEKVFEQVSLAKPITVDAQLLPDEKFPTVAFPNPEEPGAMDLSFQLAMGVKADLIIANDPDADRLAVGVPDERADSGWRRLTGDELGLLLGYEVAKRAHQQGKKGTIACSIVSSSALSKVAEEFGFGYQETLTGFKYIAKVPNLIFGYEEALGYCVDPENTPDKDGISAALVVAALASELAAQGKTLLDQLAFLSDRFGYFATGQISIRVTDLSLITKQVKALRDNPPSEIDGIKAKFTDLSIATANLGATDALRFDLADSRRVIIRPSGTEPKLKCYLQAIGETKIAAVESLAALNKAMGQLIK